MQPLICLVGPTASGKTDLALHLVQQFPFDIISVDSAMVYRGMNIGTAKPTPAILAKTPHRLIDICDPCDSYSVAQFRQDALHAIQEIKSNQRYPLLVGGTMLYFHALEKGLAEMPVADTSLRLMLNREGQEYGWPLLHERLVKIDPEAGRRIHPNDSQRIQRALEVYLLSGKTISALKKEQTPPALDAIHYLILAPSNRPMLHERIANRFKQMLASGLVAEVEELLARGDLTPAMPAMRSVGYRQIGAYLKGELQYDEMCAKGIIATRQLAKRQLTWLRRFKQARWFDSEAPDLFSQVLHYLEKEVFAKVS